MLERLLVPVVISVAASGCGLGLGEASSGGDSNLPTLAAGPYRKLPYDREGALNEPYVVESNGVSYTDPSAVLRDDGVYQLWFARRDTANLVRTEIWYAELPSSLRESLELTPVPALVPEQAWEGDRVTRPSVVTAPDGSLVMFYEAGPEQEPVIGRAESLDGGRSWNRTGLVLAGATAPAAAYADDELLLVVTLPDRAGIFRVDLADATVGTVELIAPRLGESEAFDGAAVQDPSLLARRTAAGQLHYGLWFGGQQVIRSDELRSSIGFAAAFDHQNYQRFMGLDPVMHPTDPSEYAPSVVLEPARGVMFFHELTAGRGRIAVAIHP